MATRLDTALGMAITQTNESRVLIPTVGVYSDKPSAVIPFLVTNDDNDSLMLDFINTVCIMKSARASIVIRDLGLEPPDSMRWAFSGYHEGFVATPIAWSDFETDQTEIMSIALGIISAPIGVSDGGANQSTAGSTSKFGPTFSRRSGNRVHNKTTAHQRRSESLVLTR